jgi:ATP-dependent DNA helicase RecQ
LPFPRAAHFSRIFSAWSTIITMKVRIFLLRFNSMTETFDDSAVAGFIADKEALSVENHFFVKDEVPYLTL